MFFSLLNKAIKFFRHPATNWSFQRQPQAGKEEAYSKQLLKEMIERKRRNDFVRKREFDILRKMRKRDAMNGQELGVARPSFFHSSLPSTPDDRAVTLRKIDEIEAQMSMQWWKTKHGAVSAAGATSSSFPASLQMSEAPADAPESLLDDVLPGTYAATAPAPLHLQALEVPGAGYDGAVPGFTASKVFAVEVGQVTHDAELEEAAIYFSNGEQAQTEACLIDALGPQGVKSNHLETWLTLFDFYRITGQQEKFESLVLDFVGRFSRSPPQWFCVPDLVRSLANPDDTQTLETAGQGSVMDWVCPPEVDAQALAALNTVLDKAAMPWRLDWSGLQSIEEQVAEPLDKLFHSWASRAVQLRFLGQDQLLQVLKTVVRSGSGLSQVDPVWWHLLMQVLRVLHRPDDFELVALDFCVKYEVSPPAWESAMCSYKSLDATHASLMGQTIIGDAYRDTSNEVGPQEADTVIEDPHVDTSSLSQLYTVELSGQIQGDALAMLQELEEKFQTAAVMRIACARLIRVDFSAAGALLNWVAARHAEGRVVQFTEVNRLVAAFFSTMGITTHAKVTVQVSA